MMQWQGTFLSAAFLAPSSLWSDLPDILAIWQRSGLMNAGRAKWLQLPPDEVSYERIMEGQQAIEEEWEGTSDVLLALSQRYTLSTIVLPFSWHHAEGNLMIDFLVYADNSVGVYINAPYQSIYEEVDRSIGEANLSLFIDVACSLFVANAFIIGCIQEEAQFDGLDALIRGGQLPADWAFYGTTIGRFLQAIGSLPLQALKLRKLPDDGLFVEWTEWDEPPGGPIEWRESLAQTIGLLKMELAGGSGA